MIKIHHPRDWYQFVRSIGLKKQFLVTEMDQNNIFDFGNAAKQLFTWRKVDNAGEKYNWNDIKWFRFTKEFGKVYFKKSLNEEDPFKFINIQKRGINSVKINDLKICYEGPIQINASKKNDLLDMLPLVDEIYRDFYKNLNIVNTLDFHPDLTECDDSYE